MTKMMTTEELSELLQISVITLARWRMQGTGPRYLKLGPSTKSHVRYDPADVATFIKGARKMAVREQVAP